MTDNTKSIPHKHLNATGCPALLILLLKHVEDGVEEVNDGLSGLDFGPCLLPLLFFNFIHHLPLMYISHVALDPLL